MTTVHRIHSLSPIADRFQVDVCHEDPGEVVIYVRGELDLATAPVLGTCLSNVLDADLPCRALAVDLSRCAIRRHGPGSAGLQHCSG